MGEAGEVIHKAVASGRETATANPQTSSEDLGGYLPLRLKPICSQRRREAVSPLQRRMRGNVE